MRFKHFVITRYNVNVKGWETTRDKEPIDENWMKHRFELFTQFCLPSVLGQSCLDFTWLIFMDIHTKEPFIHELEKLVSPHSNIHLVFIGDSTEFYRSLCESIGAHLNGEEFLITTRLDNDDAIRNDYIESIQNEFQKQEYTLVEFPDGLSLQIEPKKRLALIHDRYNPFMSLIEKIEQLPQGIRFKTVMYYQQHRQWKESGAELISKNEKRPWLQIIHSKNKANFFNAKILTNNTTQLSGFSCELPEIERQTFLKKATHYLKTVFS